MLEWAAPVLESATADDLISIHKIGLTIDHRQVG